MEDLKFDFLQDRNELRKNQFAKIKGGSIGGTIGGTIGCTINVKKDEI